MRNYTKYIILGIALALAPAASAIGFTGAAGDQDGMTWTLDGPVTGRFVGTSVVVLQGSDIMSWSKYSGIENVVVDRKVAVSVYPNPVVTDLHIQGACDGACWRIVGIDGRTAARGVLAEGLIDCSALAKGTYILTICDQATCTAHSQIIIKK